MIKEWICESRVDEGSKLKAQSSKLKAGKA
jgi:hypothetical protein